MRVLKHHFLAIIVCADDVTKSKTYLTLNDCVRTCICFAGVKKTSKTLQSYSAVKELNVS